VHGNERSPATRLQLMACVFGFYLIVEGLRVIPFCRVWSDSLYFWLRCHCV